MRTIRKRFLTIVGAAGVLAAGASAPAQVARLGALGDSLTDEYSEETYSYAHNWTMQLVQYRGVNMGLTAQAAGQPGGTWGEPRRTGFQYNWARYGADSASAIADGQHTGLASQAGPGGVTHAVLAIGTNDLSPSSNAFFNIYWGFWSQSQIDSYVNSRVANVRTIAETVDASGANVVLCNYVDFSVAPVTRQIYGVAAWRNRVTAVVTRMNQGVEDIARQRRLLLVDLNLLGTTILGTNTSLRQFLAIGNVNIQLFNRDTTAHANPLAGFVDDGAHPHTTLQGVFANVMMTALNTGWGSTYALFSDTEILAHGGIAYGGADTLDAQVGPYSRYIRSYMCPADFNADQTVNTQDLAILLGRFGQSVAPGTEGDANGDGFVNTQDLATLLGTFGQNCPS